MSTPLDGYEVNLHGVTFVLDLKLNVQSLRVESLTIEEIQWWFNDTGHRVDCPVGVDLTVLKAELLDEVNNEFHREKIAEKHHDRLEAITGDF